MDCNKLKKKAVIGFILISIIPLSKIIDLFLFPIVDYIDLGIGITIIIMLGVIGLYLGLPYIRCLDDYNKRSKPPFGR